MNVTSPEQIIPLTPQTAAILLALLAKPQYGYSIGQMVKHDSKGCLEMSAGSVHPALRRLEVQGYVAVDGYNSNTSSPYKRKMYRLTEQGRSLLKAEMERQGGFVALARHRLRHG